MNKSKYIVSCGNNNIIYRNNLHYKKMFREMGCDSLTIFDRKTMEIILKSEMMPNGEIYLAIDNR